LQSNCDRYGRLYTYEAANNACPKEWHLPSDDEWKKLEIELGMQDVVNETGWRGTSPGQGKLMKIGGKSGLNVELTGFRNYGGYENMDDNAYFWTSTLAISNNEKAFSRELKERASVKREESDVNLGYSVRCIEGSPNSENSIVPNDEKIDKLISNHERNYFSIGVGSGAVCGYIGLKAEAKFGIKNFGLGVQYGMGFLPDIPHYSIGAKLYYRYFYLNTLICNDDSYDGFNQFAVLIGLDYPLSKNFNISGGLGYYSSDLPVTWELGINYKIFK